MLDIGNRVPTMRTEVAVFHVGRFLWVSGYVDEFERQSGRIGGLAHRVSLVDIEMPLVGMDTGKSLCRGPVEEGCLWGILPREE